MANRAYRLVGASSDGKDLVLTFQRDPKVAGVKTVITMSVAVPAAQVLEMFADVLMKGEE